MRFLISAGPTREMIDDVRFLSNGSSGKTGFAVAAAARDAGHEVTLVTGPVNLPDPDGITTVRVVSAREMYAAMMERRGNADVIIMTAAVSDYRPADRFDGKLKKTDDDLVLRLERNPDILMALGEDKGERVHIGFALEVQDAEKHARGKLERKNLDLIVLNGPGNLGASVSSFRVLGRNGLEVSDSVPKEELGTLLVRLAEEVRPK